MKNTNKKPVHPLDKSNPQTLETSLIEIKKRKRQQSLVKNLKQKIDKQLNFMMSKDQSLLKEFIRKKQSLIKEKQKQQQFIQNLQYKQWLSEMRQMKNQEQKKQTQEMKTKLKEALTSAYDKDHKTKKKLAINMKSTIEEWMKQKYQKQQQLLDLNRSRFTQTRTQRTLSRESSKRFFEEKHSRIVKRSLRQIESRQKSVNKDLHDIDRIEKDLLSIRHKSESRIKMIQEVENDILSVKNQTLNLSRTRSVKLSTMMRQNQKNYQEKIKQTHENMVKLKFLDSKSPKQKRKLSLPLISYKKIHNQI